MPDPTRKTISATQSPALWNVSPYYTRWMLWQHFANGMAIDEPNPNARMDWGKKLQPIIIQQAADELRLEVIPNADDTYHTRGLLGCTRDATIICPDRGPGALETKCVFDYATWMREWDGGKSVPRHHEIQLQQQCLVGEGTARPHYNWGIIVAWVGAELFYFEREPIRDLWKRLQLDAEAFFRSITDKKEPDPFGSPIEVPWLTELFPTVAGKTLDLREDHAHVKTSEDVSMFVHHRETKSGAEKSAEVLRAKLLALAKEHETVLLPCGVNFRVQKSGKGKTIKPYVPDVPTPPPLAPDRNIFA